jgi:DNA-binding response OmpR family regulator
MPPYDAGVLIADHEPEVGEMARRYLARAGLAARVVTSPGPVLGALASGSADLFVIDLTMPGLGVPAIRRALAGRSAASRRGAPHPAGTTPVPPGLATRRGADGARPVVFLLDRHGIRPRGLSDGLDCARMFLARPFSPRVLADAVTELLRPAAGGRCAPGRPGPPASAPVAVLPAAGLHLDGDHRKAIVAGTEIGLTRTEFALLAALAAHPGRALSRQSLLMALEAERGKRPTARAIDVYITQLRAKLGADVLATVHGVGYALCWPVPDESPLARLAPPYPGIANALRRQT